MALDAGWQSSTIGVNLILSLNQQIPTRQTASYSPAVILR